MPTPAKLHHAVGHDLDSRRGVEVRRRLYVRRMVRNGALERVMKYSCPTLRMGYRGGKVGHTAGDHCGCSDDGDDKRRQEWS